MFRLKAGHHGFFSKTRQLFHWVDGYLLVGLKPDKLLILF